MSKEALLWVAEHPQEHSIAWSLQLRMAARHNMVSGEAIYNAMKLARELKLSVKELREIVNISNANSQVPISFTDVKVSANFPRFIPIFRGTKTKLTGDMFNRFYKAYPKSVARPAAEKAWLKLNPDAALYEVIMRDIEHRFIAEEFKLIPYPATYLNQRRFEDEQGLSLHMDTLKKVPFQEIVDLYNKTLPRLMPIDIVTAKVKVLIGEFWEADVKHQNITFYNNYFRYCNNFPKLLGENRNRWAADLWWLMDIDNFNKVKNGKFL